MQLFSFHEDFFYALLLVNGLHKIQKYLLNKMGDGVADEFSVFVQVARGCWRWGWIRAWSWYWCLQDVTRWRLVITEAVTRAEYITSPIPTCLPSINPRPSRKINQKLSSRKISSAENARAVSGFRDVIVIPSRSQLIKSARQRRKPHQAAQ